MSNELRPHHALCLRFFEGKGYSKGFTAHMAQVHGELTEDALVYLTAGEDVICAFCPNSGTGCPDAARYDRTVLELCGLSPGETLTWGRFSKLVRRRILAEGKLSQVCGDCQWAHVCGSKQI
ncbi:DUF1284 domain-containing protein [Oscillibacter sp. MSJ-2]|uniref:DUF1284 domain-containing protein n=1 Tax=Dysosmobacter acutus TaxID=2841504 RepID=A0ABS6FAI1_9FIRM|nr:DUF1284 domain-containing protein [Dysosmobacter acutus]MBU5626304.1 DUF1284 domain-containing protein [Dysosmobacter acutus]